MSGLPDWTKLGPNEKADAILPLLKAGKSNNAIAAHFLNCGTSQVSGAVARMKAAGLMPPARRAPLKQRKKKAAAEPKAPPAPKPSVKKPTARAAEATSWRGANNPHHVDLKARAAQRAASPGLSPALIAGTPIRPKEELRQAPEPRRLALMNLTDATCRWPHGHPFADDFGFCGNPTTGKPPYCRYHARLAFIPATVRQRASLRSAERIK